ncbi:MAG: dienelactone hydrolase family protein [Clostridia bacterium]|nr:dienelactone hydrolase family protein [Clostridia bacterium]
MIVSAISLWKKYNLNTPLGVSIWGEEDKGDRTYSHVSYSGHESTDGSVRIYARFARPNTEAKTPAVLLLPDAGETPDTELMDYFVDRGYAVLVPDYSGKMSSDDGTVMRTVYPESLSQGNYERAEGLHSLMDVDSDKTCWVEWTYVALYSVKYLKSRPDIGNIGVVGVRTGGEIAWQTMLSPDVKCGVPINAAGWYSFLNIAKFGANVAHHLSDNRHRYIAAVEAQSYAPYVKCPVLMLCALRDRRFDSDRAYDTYSRIGNSDGNALVYSPDSGACIGPNALLDMDLFLEKNLKGREVYIPETLNVSLKDTDGGVEILVESDKEGILEEAGIFYAEADVKTRSTYREWRCVHKVQGRTVKNGTFRHIVKPFEGATAVFVYAYAKYINGFRVTSKIASKRLTRPDTGVVKSRRLFSGQEMDCFGVAEYEDYSVGGIFLERDAVPKMSVGYGGINGAYSVGGIRTYKISSPRYVPEENALLEFDAYSKETQTLLVTIEVADVETEEERYSCEVAVKGGGKWKRIILKAADFKGETYGAPLANFYNGSALVFDCAEEEKEFAITNILWL